jgi:hypothetical protein
MRDDTKGAAVAEVRWGDGMRVVEVEGGGGCVCV